MRNYNPYLFLYLVPGLLLVLASTYYPSELLYKQIAWTKTEALLVEKEVNTRGADIEVLKLMQFKDKDGNVHTIKENDDNDV